MQYLGGKSKIRKQIAAFLESLRKPNQVYFEPFPSPKAYDCVTPFLYM